MINAILLPEKVYFEVPISVELYIICLSLVIIFTSNDGIYHQR